MEERNERNNPPGVILVTVCLKLLWFPTFCKGAAKVLARLRRLI